MTSAVRSAMEPFLQNMAQVVGEQTAQITVVNQRVEQLASVVSQMNLNYSSNVPVAGSNAANVGSPSPPRNQQSSSGLSSVSGFGERPPVSPVRNFGVPVMTAEEFQSMKDQVLLLLEQRSVRRTSSLRVRSGCQRCHYLTFRSGRSLVKKRFCVSQNICLSFEVGLRWHPMFLPLRLKVRFGILRNSTWVV